MRKIFSGLIATSLAFLLFAMPINSANAAPAKFKNCTELNKTYPGGVAKDAKVRNVGGKTKYKPFVSAEIYKLHTKMDRDKDGIACER
ncbi:excalibur calcium-binding domain-containing protein [Sporosarcina highlanderae]|uniref:Excalibur calcium-binding domain-containing protein n=1 Tax=Sporosarcina highlanderae TaxID=3035916 RepID=A0ABT8JVN8_9BACL|nr:excalibur calcium-binding domain-containing protein [Sporosarcina highlanderae]MDN4609234.1 excalibur calcium-binding domain-containing protein [Sporosarcina highlanderae]